MIPAPRHLERMIRALARHPNHQPMPAVDPPRPPARQIATERFGLAHACEARTVAKANRRIRGDSPCATCYGFMQSPECIRELLVQDVPLVTFRYLTLMYPESFTSAEMPFVNWPPIIV